MRQHFEGMCIAGPMAGQHTAQQAETFKVYEEPPLNHRGCPSPAEMETLVHEEVKIHIYRYVCIYRDGKADGELGFFVHESHSTDQEQILVTLMRGYRDDEKLKRQKAKSLKGFYDRMERG